MKVPENKNLQMQKKGKRKPPVPQIDSRQPRQSGQTAKRRRRKKNYTFYYILFAIIIAAVLIVLANTVLFNVSEIVVEGETTYSAEQIIEASELITGKNLLHINTEDAAQKIMNKLILVDNVKVHKQFPNKLLIAVAPAERFANIEHDSKYCIISFGDKVLIDASPSADSKIPIVKGYNPGEIIEGSTVKSEDEAKTKLLHDIYDDLIAVGLWDKTTEIDITDRFSILIVYDGRIIMECGTSTELKGKLNIAKELITNKIGASEQVRVLLQDTDKVYVQDNYAHQTLPPVVVTEEALTDETGTDETSDTSSSDEKPTE